MSERNQPTNNKEPTSERKPYIPPAVDSEEAFETMAMACAVVFDICDGASS